MTPPESNSALEQLRATVDVADLIGVTPPGATGPFLARSISVSVGAPDYLDTPF